MVKMVNGEKWYLETLEMKIQYEYANIHAQILHDKCMIYKKNIGIF